MEEELGPLPEHRLNLYPLITSSSQLIRQRFTYVQTQSSTSFIDLTGLSHHGEHLKQLGNILLFYPNTSVFYCYFYQFLSFLSNYLRSDLDLTLEGKLYSITN